MNVTNTATRMGTKTDQGAYLIEDDFMTMHPISKTHPMVLTAAVAVTVFSIIGSAAITGLIPSAHSSHSASYEPLGANHIQPNSDTGRTNTFKSSVTGKDEAKNTTSFSSRVSARDKPALMRNDTHQAANTCSVCGVIESIRAMGQEGEVSGLGAVAGGIVGGAAGNQIGKGKGNTVMTILGIGGGAYAGHTIEKNMKSTTVYVIRVRMEDGTYRKVTQNSQPEFAVGDHVRVAHGSLTST